MIGEVIGNYRVTDKIGEGGMGAVFKATDLMLEREVAIKMLRQELASQPEVLERFRSEAVTLGRLNHPNIATLYSFFREGADFFMVMEFVDGKSLDQAIRQMGAMPCEQAIPLFCQALEGIDYAHSMLVIHRDIKPSNIMLTGAGALKVMDFGIARLSERPPDAGQALTAVGVVVGTPQYMAPEQLMGGDVDGRSDLYSVGVVLYECLAGRPPFDAESPVCLAAQMVEGRLRPIIDLVPDVPVRLAVTIHQLLNLQPQNRVASARELANTLAEIENSVP
jgi:serine/threonine-protein kinase